ncbi:(2,3-dihydroxybenzoyl)adenylate synthase [Actinoplanes teichomyceticus]|uniref:2,3-dihydroxybenzoate-AMP ligase n=1 Tax=Actinoplanes teichomyceticus TaxID=1867 RepID=A0A561WBV3_ACTTI|nr:AMP-binding protein [Actinoplanes teichomyceticus]TWG21350.1 2,3-dihydroxybenzoate-AMP ligase [Actinoplanes teichomyceticus]GIF16435.1 2,3-dihydroxybenzoate-AMP ligase [Actinoplanes teichomyceticus]
MSVTASRAGRPEVVPWPDELAERYVARGYWEQRPLGAYLDDAAAGRPGTICLVDGDVSLTFAELVSRVDGAAQRLHGLGLRAGDRVIVQLPNCWEFVVIALACFRSGVVPVMALPAHRRQELTAIARLTEARALLVAGTVRGFDHEQLAHEVAAAVPGLRHVAVTGRRNRPDSLDLVALCAPAGDTSARAAAPDPGDVALFLLSGGTTGRPKLIPRTHNDYAYMMRTAARICGAGPDTVYLAVLPLAHGYPMAGPGILGTLVSGGRIVILASPAPQRALAAIAEHRVTMTSLVPAAVIRWLDHLAGSPAADLDSLDLVQVAGSRLPDEVAARVTPALGARLQQVYGMAEGLLCMTRPGDPDAVVHHTQGRPICPDDELLLVDEDGTPVPIGEPGILLTRGPYTPLGYYREPELTAAAYPPGGWYRTGDVVRLRADGNLVIEGRDKDLINRGGEKIAAEEVENFAHQLATVSQAAAVAMPDPELGEAVCLYVVPRAGSTVTLAQVRDVMREAGVAAFKLPERLELVDSLPVTAIGKVDKKALRADIARRRHP